MERGVHRPSFESLIMLCETLHVTSDYLILGIEDDNENKSCFHWFSILSPQKKEDLIKGVHVLNDVMKELQS